MPAKTKNPELRSLAVVFTDKPGGEVAVTFECRDGGTMTPKAMKTGTKAEQAIAALMYTMAEGARPGDLSVTDKAGKRRVL